MQILRPPGWARPKGYSHGVAAKGKFVFVSGLVGWDENGRFAQPGNFLAQAERALRNVVAVLAEAQAKPEHIVRMNWYVIDKGEYLDAGKQLGAIYREVIGRHYPAMTAVQVTALMEDQARVEIEVTAVLPDE